MLGFNKKVAHQKSHHGQSNGVKRKWGEHGHSQRDKQHRDSAGRAGKFTNGSDRTRAAQKSQNGSTDTSMSHRMGSKELEVQRARTQLPIYQHVSEIRRALHDKDVLVLVGETGSGKSTQVPQYLMTEPWCRRCIAVTQPRRVAAISLAKRVAQELGGAALEHARCRVGYSVRFDQKVGPGVKIKFLTEGMLLQEMLADPLLTQYSAVIVDEVHERSVNVDLILGFVKQLVDSRSKRKGAGPLKSVVMSATADVEALQKFFEQTNVGEDDRAGGDKQQIRQKISDEVSADGRKDRGQQDSDSSSWSGIHSDSSNARDEATAAQRQDKSARMEIASTKGVSRDQCQPRAVQSPCVTLEEMSERLAAAQAENLDSPKVACCHIRGRQYPVEINYLPEATADFQEAALKTIFQIHYKEPLPGDVLVFLTGQDTVEAVEGLVNEYAGVMDDQVPKMLVLPLFGALPQVAQQAVFDKTPPRTRKIVLATNMAETSVTIPGVRFVVDCGLAKFKEFRSKLGLDSLLVKAISKSSATQRAGRAGREAAGKAYRLYTETEHLRMATADAPEILRCDLAAAMLGIKARGIDSVAGFPLLTRPKRESLRRALLQLHRLGALTDEGRVSAQGRRMAGLPLAPALARVLVGAGGRGRSCALAVVDIISCLAVENVFVGVASEERREEAEAARRELQRREGDHLTLLATVRAYSAASDRRRWAQQHFVSHRAMANVMRVRRQLWEQCERHGLLLPGEATGRGSGAGAGSGAGPGAGAGREEGDDDGDDDGDDSNQDLGEQLLRCFLLGFASNTARLMPDGSYRTLEGNQTVAIHPSSVLFGRKVEAIMYNELVFTNRSYARGVSAIQVDWYGAAVG